MIYLDALVDDLYCIAAGTPIGRPIADVCREACVYFATTLRRSDTGEFLFASYADLLEHPALTKDSHAD